MNLHTWSFNQIVVGVAGLGYLLIGVTQLFAPQWFFDNIGNFPPFNRHYVGDLGAFTAAIGVGLLFAMRTPQAHRSLIAVVAFGSLLHLLNHLYDDAISGHWSLAHVLSETLPLLALAVLLLAVWRRLAAQT
jgi:predicted anti-sigma-YlaC factor YlaD